MLFLCCSVCACFLLSDMVKPPKLVGNLGVFGVQFRPNHFSCGYMSQTRLLEVSHGKHVKEILLGH